MRHAAALTTFLALTFGSTTAMAGGWADFVSAFPLTPCQDGWLGCIINGEAVGPNLIRDSSGAPSPADLRVGWFDLEGTTSFSPFPQLSVYRGELSRKPEPEVAQVDPDPRPITPRAEPRPDPGHDSRPDPTPAPAHRAEPSTPEPAADPGPRSGSRVTVQRVGSGSTSSEKETVSSEREPQPTTSAPDPKPSSLGDGGSGTADDDKGGASQAVIEKPKPPPVEDADCSNLKRLEPMAMLGRLSDGQKKCLETELGAAARQTDKDKLSRVLMTDAWASNDRKQWEKLVKRHLDEIDRSDPDLCYKYAVHLSRKGAGSANAVIRWADVALENKTVWTGDTYTNRVFALLRLRAAAAQALWQAAENAFKNDATDANRSNRDNSRNRTKVLSREWYEYAKSAGKPADQARALCMAAAGTEDYCEGA